MAENKDPHSKPLVAESDEASLRETQTVSTTSSDGQTTINILLHYCKGCEICVEVCPKNVLRMVVASDRWEGTMVEVIDIDACNACLLCENQCPDFAIECRNVKKEKKRKEKLAVGL